MVHPRVLIEIRHRKHRLAVAVRASHCFCLKIIQFFHAYLSRMNDRCEMFFTGLLGTGEFIQLIRFQRKPRN